MGSRLCHVALALAVPLLLCGCGSGRSNITRSSDSNDRAPAGTIAALLARPGQDVALVAGTGNFVPGRIRLSFLVVRHDGRVVNRDAARVWIATGLRKKPYSEVQAALEPVGVPGKSGAYAGDVTRIYVAHLTAPRPGKYWVLAEPIGGRPATQALGNVIVAAKSSEPAIGAKAIASMTPTLASEHGRVGVLTTATPPDLALLRYSVADSIAARKPFVLVFATPKFCMSRTCGPVVDVVGAVQRRFARSGVRFIHVEIYKDNNPARGYNRWVKQWRLPSEPWTFLVGPDGRIRAKFEGSLSVAELGAAVRRSLLAA